MTNGTRRGVVKEKMIVNLNLIAQICGIGGFLFAVFSFQTKKNRSFFIFQGISGFMFFLNFLFIGAVSATLFNFVNLIRGVFFSKNDGKRYKLIIIEALYTACFIFSITKNIGDPMQIFLSALTFIALLVMSIFMSGGNGKNIRYFQFLFVSPVWLIHNLVNFSLGGILCEAFNMLSVVVSFIRYGRDGFEK